MFFVFFISIYFLFIELNVVYGMWYVLYRMYDKLRHFDGMIFLFFTTLKYFLFICIFLLCQNIKQIEWRLWHKRTKKSNHVKKVREKETQQLQFPENWHIVYSTLKYCNSFELNAALNLNFTSIYDFSKLTCRLPMWNIVKFSLTNNCIKKRKKTRK